MKTIKIQDRFNSAKVWVITRYSCGHYWVNQEIHGRRFYAKNTKTKAKSINTVLDIDITKVLASVMDVTTITLRSV